MFWMIRKTISWGLTLLAFALLLVLVMPGDYQREVSIDIRSPRDKVYTQARRLSEWNALATFADLSRKRLEIPPEVAEYGTAGLLDWISDANRGLDGAAAHVPQLRITEARYPALLVYRVDGGPLPGVEPRISIEEVPSRDLRTTTRVTIVESYRFFGFWAGVKALSARFAAERLHLRNLERLRELCEGPRETREAESNRVVEVDPGEILESVEQGLDKIDGKDPRLSYRQEVERVRGELRRMEADMHRVREDMQRVIRERN